MKSFLIILFLVFFSACAKREPELRFIPQHSGTQASLRGLHAVNDRTAWASGSVGTYAITINGGKTWETGVVPGQSEFDFRDIHAWSKNRAVLLSAGFPAKIFLTEDGGKSWEEVYRNETRGVFFNALAFWNGTHGLAVSDPVDSTFVIIKTTDGGKSWKQIPRPNLPPALDNEAGFAASGSCLFVYGEGLAWFGTGGSAARVFKSEDWGNTWQAFDTPVISGEASQGIFSIAFWSAENGIAVGGDYRQYNETRASAALTQDGGMTWELIDNAGLTGFRSSAAVLSGKHPATLIAAGTNGSDLSVDGGKTWTYADSTDWHVIDFAPSGRTGWAAGSKGRIAKITYK